MTGNGNKQAGFGRITVILLCFILVSILLPTLLAGYLSITAQKRHYVENLRQDRARLLNTLSSTLASPVWNVRVDQVDQIVTSFLSLPYLKEVSVYDTISKTQIYKKTGSHLAETENITYEKQEIISHGQVIGEVQIACSSDYYDQQLKRDIKELVILFLSLFVITSVFVSIVIFKFLLTPLLNLVQQSLKTEDHSLEIPLDKKWSSPIEKIQYEIVFLLNEFQRYYQIVDQNTMTLRLDSSGQTIHSSEAYKKLFDRDLLTGDDESILFGIKIAEMKGGWQGEVFCHSKDGREVWLNVNITADKFEENLNGYVVVCDNITDKKLIEKIAVTDKLTGLFNRVKIDEELASQFALFERYKTLFSCILLDLDYFKQVNDTHGHQVGDQVLQGISDLLSKNVRKTDMVGRWGGEEFIIICPNTSLDDGVQFAKNIHQVMANAVFIKDITMTCSMGVSCVAFGDNSQDDFIKRVDEALYRSKNTGRNTINIADE